MKNYYEILQVSPHASDDIIEKAYKVLAKTYHPDLQKSLSNKSYAEQRLKEINEAYNVLKDEFLREQYDFELKKEQDNIFNEEIRKRSLNKNDNQENEKPKKQKYEETNNYENPDTYRNNDINHRQEFSRYEYAKMRKQEIEAEEFYLFHYIQRSDIQNISMFLYTHEIQQFLHQLIHIICAVAYHGDVIFKRFINLA